MVLPVYRQNHRKYKEIRLWRSPVGTVYTQNHREYEEIRVWKVP